MFAVRMLLIPMMIFMFSANASATIATILKVGAGTMVKVSRAGQVVRLKEGDVLQSGDELSTDAETSVDLRLEDDTLIRIGVKSTYKIQEDSKVNSLVHRLVTGIVRVLVPKSESKTSGIKFRLYTPEGTIGVRGTEFVVIRSDGATQLKGLDGTVLFGPAETDFGNESAFVMVTRGFQSSILANAKAAKKAEKFDLKKYLDDVNAKHGPFGPLAVNNGQSNKGYARGDGMPAPAAAPTKMDVGGGEKKPTGKLAVGGGSPNTPRAKATDYLTMLVNGVQDGDLEAVTKAVEHGASPSTKNTNGFSMLQVSMSQADDKVFNYLIEKGADVNAKNKDGQTALMLVAVGHLEMKYALLLVDPGAADIDLKDNKGKTAADLAAEIGFTELATYLNSDEADKDSVRALEAKLKAQKKTKK